MAQVNADDFIQRINAGLRDTGPRRAMEKRPKFDNNQAKTNFPAYVQAMETEVFRPQHTEEQKIECLRQLVSGDYAAKVTEAFENYAIQWSADHPCNGGAQASAFRSPVKGKNLEAAVPYAPTYETIKAVAIQAVLGDDAHADMLAVLHQQRQGPQDVEAYNRKFTNSLDLYVMCGGPSIASNLHQYRKLYRQGLNENIRSRIQNIPPTMSDEMAGAHSIERSLKLSGVLDAVTPGRTPSAFVMQTPKVPVIDETAASFADAIAKCSSTTAVAEQIDTFSRAVCNKPLDTIDILQSHANGTINLNNVAKDVIAKADAGTHILPIIASIHHILPSSIIRETFRSTRITEKHDDLQELSKNGLKRLRRLKEHVNKKEVSSDSDDDRDMEDHGDTKRRRSSRRGEETAAAFTKVADELRTLNGTQTELLQNLRSAIPNPGPYQAYPTAAVLTTAPSNNHQFQPLPPPPTSPFPNKNTSRSVPRPWKNDRSWPGCKRCHSLAHSRADECPGKDANTPFCHFCLQDGHAIPTCPHLQKKQCSNCGRRGNDSRHCICNQSKKD